MKAKDNRNYIYQPVVKEGIPRANPWEAEYQNFWNLQIDRCINGYKPHGHAWIPGRYYFYLNFLKIASAYNAGKSGRKSLIYPYYRDIDHEYALKIEQAKKEHKGIIVLKARRKGQTISNIGMTCVYESTMPTANEIGIGCFSEDQIKSFRVRFEEVYSTLSTYFKQNRIIDNQDIIKFGEKTKVDGKIYESGSLNKIYFKDFWNKTGAFRGHSLQFLLFEEAGENPLLKKAFLVSEECFKEGGIQFGIPIIFGTSNQINNGHKDLQDMYYDSDKYNLIKHFIPASKAYYPFINLNNGKSDVEGATQDIEKQRAIKKSIEDKVAYYTFLQEMPLKESDCFMLGASNIFNLDKIHSQIEYIEDNKRIKGMIQRGDLKWVKSIEGSYMNQVEWVPSPTGNMKMLYSPLKEDSGAINNGFVDVGGVDPYRKDESNTSDSKGALYVYRGVTNMNIPDNMLIFEYFDRPSTKEEFYDNCAKVAIYYNCKLLVEDTDEDFFKFFISNGLVKYLKESPAVYKTIFTKASNRFGYNISGSGRKLKVIENISDYVEKESHRIYYLELLKELTIFGTANTDRAMAFGMALVHSLDNVHMRMSQFKKDTVNKLKYPGLKEINGVITKL